MNPNQNQNQSQSNTFLKILEGAGILGKKAASDLLQGINTQVTPVGMIRTNVENLVNNPTQEQVLQKDLKTVPEDLYNSLKAAGYITTPLTNLLGMGISGAIKAGSNIISDKPVSQDLAQSMAQGMSQASPYGPLTAANPFLKDIIAGKYVGSPGQYSLPVRALTGGLRNELEGLLLGAIEPTNNRMKTVSDEVKNGFLLGLLGQGSSDLASLGVDRTKNVFNDLKDLLNNKWQYRNLKINDMYNEPLASTIKLKEPQVLPEHQLQIEKAMNAGDYVKAQEIIDNIPESSPYKASMQDMIDQLKPQPPVSSEGKINLSNLKDVDGKPKAEDILKTGKPITIDAVRATDNPTKEGLFWSTEYIPAYGSNKVQKKLSFKNPVVFEDQFDAVEKLFGKDARSAMSDDFSSLGGVSTNPVYALNNPKVTNFFAEYDKKILSQAKKQGFDGLIFTRGTTEPGEIVDLVKFDPSKTLQYKPSSASIKNVGDIKSLSDKWVYDRGDDIHVLKDRYIVGQDNETGKFVAFDEKAQKTIGNYNNLIDAQLSIQKYIDNK